MTHFANSWACVRKSAYSSKVDRFSRIKAGRATRDRSIPKRIFDNMYMIILLCSLMPVGGVE